MPNSRMIYVVCSNVYYKKQNPNQQYNYKFDKDDSHV